MSVARVCVHTCVRAYMRSYVCAYMRAFRHACIHACRQGLPGTTKVLQLYRHDKAGNGTVWHSIEKKKLHKRYVHTAMHGI